MISALTAASAQSIWENLAEIRQSLPGYRQEFEFSQSIRQSGATQGAKRQITVDGAGRKWREQSGGTVRVFDGADLFRFEDDGGEYEKPKRRAKDPEPLPLPYLASNADWTKAVELERRPCGYQNDDRPCVLLEAPIRPWTRTSAQIIEGPSGRYQSDMICVLRRSTFGQAPNANLFRLPERPMKEVKELAQWDAPRIRKQLAGKPAPDFSFVDLAGRPLSLASLQGKIILLDFWTTWCPPCRADAPSLDKLHKKYGDRDLAIIGISVNEERATVEKFLKGHPHDFPVVLSSENELPRPYDIGVFPTYLVIDREGKLYAAVQGDQGFGELRRLLKKAGLDVD